MSSRIEDLEPVTRKLCVDFLLACENAGHVLRVTHTMRTRDEQLHLYAQGRELRDGLWVVTNPSRVVTKAMPGHSAHNFGMAFDVCWEGGDPYLHAYEVAHKKVDPRWFAIGEIGEAKIGLSWGGPRGPKDDFTFDNPHFQRPNWRRARDDA